MASLDDRPAGSPLRADSPPGAGNSIPPRSRHRPAFRSGIPPQPSFKKHTIRLATATAIGVLVMILLLLLATQYAQRDWSRKNQLARSKARPLSAYLKGPAPAKAPVCRLTVTNWPGHRRSPAGANSALSRSVTS